MILVMSEKGKTLDVIDLNFLGDLSVEDLIKLEKKIKTEKEKRDAFNKSDTKVYSRLFDGFYDDLLKKGVSSDSAYNAIGRMEKAVFTLSDITLDNWRLLKEPCHADEKKLVCNGSLVYSDKDRYQEMCDKLMGVIITCKNEKNGK